VTNIAMFLTLIIATLIVGAVIGRRIEIANQRCGGLVADHRRSVDINDAAEDAWSM
jgi:hypothetical protein